MIDRVENEVDLLDRHFQILQTVIVDEPIGIVKISNKTGYPHHKVRYSLRILEDAGLVEPTAQGAMTTDHTEDFVTGVDKNLTTIIEQLDGLMFHPESEQYRSRK